MILKLIWIHIDPWYCKMCELTFWDGPSGSAGSRSAQEGAAANLHGYPPTWSQHWCFLKEHITQFSVIKCKMKLYCIPLSFVRWMLYQLYSSTQIFVFLTCSCNKCGVEVKGDDRNGQVPQVELQCSGNDVDICINVSADVSLLPICWQTSVCEHTVCWCDWTMRWTPGCHRVLMYDTELVLLGLSSQ